MHGQITISRTEIGTGKIERVVIHNTVVNGIYTKLIRMLGGSVTSDSDYKVWLQVGTGTADPDVTDFGLQNPVTPMKLMTATVAGNVVTFSGMLDTHECNGFNLSEAGLVLTDNTGGPFAATLVARATYTPMIKSVRHQFIFSWAVALKAS